MRIFGLGQDFTWIKVKEQMIVCTLIVQCKHRTGSSWFMTLNVTVLYLIYDVAVRPCSEQRLTHIDFTFTGGIVQRSVATLDAHARNNSTEKVLNELDCGSQSQL